MAYKDPKDPRRKASSRKYYEKNKLAYLARARKSEQDCVEILRKAKDVPCADCNVRYPYYVMDMDHLDGDLKVANLSKMTKTGKAQFLLELAKCEPVCANCHRERTFQRLKENK